MAHQLGLTSSSASSTTQINNQTHTYHNRSLSNANDNYNDLTLNLISNLTNKHQNEVSGLGRDYWLDDSSATKCRACDRSFTTFRRKHHCRICGKIFCSNCTTFIDGEKFNHYGRMRVCLLCLKLADRYEDYNSSEDDSVIDDTNSSFQNSEALSPQVQDSEAASTNKDVLPPIAESHIVKESAPTPPPMMAIATTRKGETVEIDIPRSNSLSRKNRGNTLFGNRSAQLAPNSEQMIRAPNFVASNHSAFHDPEPKKLLTPLNFTAAAANAAASAASSIFNFGSTPVIVSDFFHGTNDSGSTSNTRNSHHQSFLSGLSGPNNFHNRRNSNATYSFDTLNNEPNRNENNRGGTAYSSDKFGENNSATSISDSNLFLNNYNHSNRDVENGFPYGHHHNGDKGVNNAMHGTTDKGSDDESEDEQAMLAFTSLNSTSSHNQELDNISKYPTNSTLKFDESLPNSTGRRNFTSNRSRRVKNFHRLKNRRMSKSGSRVISDNNSGSIFGRAVSSTNFGFAAEDFEFLDDLLRAGESHSKQLLAQLLNDRQVEDVDLWTKVLVKCMKKISGISIDLTNGESFDISNYLKIKKIPGSTIQDSSVVDGMAFSKSLPLKSMPSEVRNPRIMIVTFQIEYEQEADRKFSSLEPLIAQQDEYLKKLVGRIVALKPNIVLANSSVNGYALQLLNEANIAVASNIKFQVLEKLSRLTKADIINSIDKLAMNPILGKCGNFEVKTYLHENVRRSYFFFTGCNLDLGFTIILRGASKEVLAKVKECANLMMYVFFNVKLESGLMRDQCLQASDYTPGKILPLYNSPINSYEDVWELFRNRILSSSPWVRFSIPFILKKLKNFESVLEENTKLYTEFVQLFKRLKDESSEEKNYLIPGMFNKYIESYEIKFDISELPMTYDDLFKLVTSIKNYRAEYYKSEIMIASRQWEQFWSSRKIAFFDPNFHQNIVTLFSMVSTKNATPCVGPDIQVIDFYWENDFCLGQFIEHICLHSNDMCSEGCGLPLREHFRSYVHGSGKVDVVLENNPRSIQGKENIIMSWSYCKICHNNTPVLPLSDNAWKYSFGKYLELSFWCRGMKVKGSSCTHDFYRDQIHYFSFQSLTVRVEYSKIQTLELVPPKFQLFWKPEHDMKIKIDTYAQVLKKTAAFFDSVRDRLNRVKVDSMTVDKMEAGQKRISELKQRVEIEHADMITLAKHIYDTVSVSDHLKLTAAIREVQDLSSDWNVEFQEFDKNFLPTEKDIKKITAFQLDRLFKTNYEPEPKSDDADSVSGKFEKDDSYEKSFVEQDDEKTETLPSDIETTERDQDGTLATGSESASPNSRRRGQLVLDKINELQQMRGPSGGSPAMSPTKYNFPQPAGVNDPLGDKRLLWESRNQELQDHIMQTHDTVLPKLSQLNNGTVKKLTEFFDAQEFFKEREREKKKLQETTFRPKVVVSRPTVEVYKNVEDAVEAQDLLRKKETESQRGIEVPLPDKTYKTNLPESSVDNTIKNKPSVTIKPDDSNLCGSDLESTGENDSDRKSLKPEISQPEKTSLLKSLTHFWADRSATLWEPLAYPLSSSEHIFVDSDVIVREDEPSSIIAFCLNTSDYSSKLNSQQQVQSQQSRQRDQRPAQSQGSDQLNALTDQQAPSEIGQSNGESIADIKNVADPALLDSEVPKMEESSKGNSTNSTDEKKVNGKSSTSADLGSGSLDLNLEQIMLKKGFHLKYQFEEGYSNISCKIFFAEQFDAFRKQCGVNLNFIESLSRCVKWDSTGGKSGSAFLKTLDSRFIIKELSRAELEAFVQFAPSYFEYFAQALFHNLPTVLVKIFGFYQIQVKTTIPGARSYTLDVLIMENLFYDRKMSRIFDLKGSMRNRHVEQTGKENEVLLDENMVEYIYESPLFVRENAKRLLRASLWNDTLFLAKMNVMDYSLVVGIDSESNELVVGIIDCIRTFTWDKKLESWVKEKGLVGGTGVGKEPTVITPKQYKNRFREAMERYILMAPGPFYQSV